MKNNPKFRVENHVRNLKHKNIFAKEYAPNWPEEVFVISKIKNTFPWTYDVISDLNGENIVGTFYQKELQKTNQKEFRIQKVMKSKENNICMSNGEDMIVHITVGLVKVI